MSYCFQRLTRRPLLGLCFAAALAGFQACSDNYDLDEKGNNPSWLGQSIYSELQNPTSGKLTGTFTNYLRLVDDLGYTETMQRTGSKTVFAANDEAFERFFANNDWNVSKYEDLTTAQKKQLLYASMLDNALLVEMLSNASGDDGVTRGQSMKHQTSANVTDTITHLYGPGDMPVNNSYWASHYATGIDVVTDNTRPMMIHFTQEQMLNNSITTTGENSDFEVITGQPYTDGIAFVFKNGIKAGASDIVCSNGYLNQMENVIVPPGNLGQVIRNAKDTKLFSRMLERFSAPFYDASTTNNYNDLAVLNGWERKDSIFAWRYFSNRSQGADTLNVDPSRTTINADELLTFDPGWNQYYSTYGTSLGDIGAMFVPTDDAIKSYFVSGGGASMIPLYSNLPNTEGNIESNLDSIPKNVIVKFLNNMMKLSFVQTVPSKFNTIMDEASDPIGITLSDIHKATDGTYDVRIANNGVAYILNRVVPPISYNIVSTPALLEPKFSVINWAIQDKTTLNQYYYAYLQASTANYALFLPTNSAFDYYYLDPTSIGTNTNGTAKTQRLLHFFTETGLNGQPTIACYSFNKDASGTIGRDSTRVAVSNVSSQLVDILNYHTVVLSKGERLGSKHYYKTKHGGTIYVTGATVGSKAMSGAQIDNGMEKPTITEVRDFSSTNGMTYVIDRVIQAPQNSVYKTLNEAANQQFSSFLELCDANASSEISSLRQWATGYSVNKIDTVYTVFTSAPGTGYTTIDKVVRFLNSYNYTVYAPNNDAMQIAYNNGLPTWDDVLAVQAQYEGSPEEATGKAKAKKMIDEINRFIRYHVQDNSIYADLEAVETTKYQTACSYNAGVAEGYQTVTVSSDGGGKFTVTDNSNNSQTIQDGGRLLVNKMTRDYIFSGSTISTSSFAAVHEITQPLNYRTGNQRYDVDWNN